MKITKNSSQKSEVRKQKSAVASVCFYGEHNIVYLALNIL